jgi:hypothetical protein
VIVNLDNLRAGIRWWERNDWEEDFLNGFYYKIYDLRSPGVTQEWWTAIVNLLMEWKAHLFKTKAEITERGAKRLTVIAACHAKLVTTATVEPNIANLSWEDVVPLFAVASEIKTVASPVFPSKMCHFLFPKLFMPVDNKATGVPDDYASYWQRMKDEWSRFDDKDEAIKILKEAIKSHKSLHPLYPFETKVIEICQIGHKHR